MKLGNFPPSTTAAGRGALANGRLGLFVRPPASCACAEGPEKSRSSKWMECCSPPAGRPHSYH